MDRWQRWSVGASQAYPSLSNLVWPTAGIGLGAWLGVWGQGWSGVCGCKKKRKTFSVEIALRLAQAPTTLYL